MEMTKRKSGLAGLLAALCLTGACALTVVITGCSPQLDQTQLSPEEQVWAEHIKANYSG